MKKIRLISSMLCVLLAFGTIFGVTVSAQENKISFVTVEKQYLAGAKSVSNAELDKAIVDGWNSMEESINISKYNISVDDIMDYYFNLVYNNPEYFYVKTEYQASYNPVTNTIYSIKPTYLVSENELSGYRTKFDSAVEKIMNHVDSTMSDFDKVLTLHDALAMNCQYDEDYYLGNKIGDMSYTAYGAFVDQNAVCQGYSLAYKLLLDKCGVESTFASSDSINHMWNIVKLGGKYYHVDVTWDDGRITSAGNYYDVSGNVSHVYFLQTDAEVKEAKNANDMKASVKATDKKYSDAFFRYTNPTNIFVVGGAYYYINTTGDVVKRVNDVETTLYKINSARWDNKGNKYKTWIPAYAMLGKMNDDLYFNESNSITKLSIQTGNASKLCDLKLPNNEVAVGLCIIDGVVYYDKQNSSGQITQIIKPDVFIGFDYSFTVDITKDGKAITDEIIYGYVGDEYKVTIKGLYDTDDIYDISVLNPDAAEYDEETGTITLLGEGQTYFTVTSIKSSLMFTVLFNISDKQNAMLGDVNGDKAINMKDVLFMRKYIAGQSVSNFNEISADVNCDERINMKDVLLMRKYIAGYPVHFGKAS